MTLRPALLGPLFAIASVAQAAGPEKVATLDRSTWPEPIANRQAYNKASQHEILQFTWVLHQQSQRGAAHLARFTSLKRTNDASIKRWLAATQTKLVVNYQLATRDCVTCLPATQWLQLVSVAKITMQTLPSSHHVWRTGSQRFYQRYLYEQLRLAALFPRITSEIDRLDESELTGDEMKDGIFLLTYDDGPSNGPLTQNLVNALNQRDIHATFFVMGERIAKNMKTADALFKHQCIGSHGHQHKSHAKWTRWSQSVAQTQALIKQIRPNAKTYFRPPYGQRSQALLAQLKSQGSQNMLWNIDSQDWNRKLSAQAVQDRVLTLMLLWRKGIILFHDVHPKGLASLPALDGLVTKAQLSWEDCRTLD